MLFTNQSTMRIDNRHSVTYVMLDFVAKVRRIELLHVYRVSNLVNFGHNASELADMMGL